jgi:phosphate transport system permease protein
VFRGIARTSGVGVLTLMSLVGLFLAYRATQALQEAGTGFLTTSAWEPEAGNFGIRAVLTGTVLIAVVAIALALPLATGTALYISEYAPARLRPLLINLVDLMAAVPSVVYGLWGFFLLQGQVVGLSRWLTTWFGWLPGFGVDGFDRDDPLSSASVFTSSTFIAGLVVCLMVTPFACSVMREVFSQAPVGEREGALALGATKLGMIRSVVLPVRQGRHHRRDDAGARAARSARPSPSSSSSRRCSSCSRTSCRTARTRCRRSSRCGTARPPTSASRP